MVGFRFNTRLRKCVCTVYMESWSLNLTISIVMRIFMS